MFFASVTYVIIHTLHQPPRNCDRARRSVRHAQRRAAGRPLTDIFLGFTLATSITGFFFPFRGVTPAIVVGVISCAILAVSYLSLYQLKLKGLARPAYIVSAIAALWLNCFVLVVQSFLKIPFLHALAPNGNEPIFGIVQLLVLGGFIYAGVLVLKRFHPGSTGAMLSMGKKAA